MSTPTRHTQPCEHLAAIRREQEVQDLLNTIEVNAGYIWTRHLKGDDDADRDASSEILDAIERLETLLLTATGLREAQP